MLNSYLLRSADSPITTEEFPEVSYKNISVNALVDSAEKYRPFLEGIKDAKQREVMKKSLADYDYYPNFSFSVAYTFRDEIAATNTPLNDFLSFVVGISIPLNYGGKVSSKVEETEAMQKLYDEQYNMSVQMLQGLFGSSVAKINSLKERIMLTEEGSLIQANENLKTTLTSYQVGKLIS